MEALLGNKERQTVIRIVAIYAIFIFLWIFISDSIVGVFIQDPVLVTRISIAKGFLFIFITASFLYKLIARLVFQMAETNRQLQTQALVLESMAEGVSVCDEQGIVRYTNPAFDSMFCYPRGELLGKHVTLLNNNPPEVNRQIFQDVAGQLYDQGSWSGEFENQTKDGRVLHTYARISTLDKPGSKNWITVQEDITERKEMERMKDEMVSAVSHEMRTPLTAMLGFLQFLLENRVDEAQMREYHATMYKEAERLNELISNFLDMQRLKARHRSYHFSSLAVVPLLEDAAALFTSPNGKHRIIIDSPCDLPEIYGDEVLLYQSLTNLLSNAIKYSPNGGDIVIGAEREGNTVTLWVKDEGIGIPRESLDKIFERFYRVDNTARRSIGGTGLGLALVREIVRAHDGRVWVESCVGKGSKFLMSLPAVTSTHRSLP